QKAPIATDEEEVHPTMKREAEEGGTPMVAELKKQLAKLGRLAESSIVLPRESSPIDHMSLNEHRPHGEMSPHSLSSPTPSVDADSKEADALCREGGRLSIVDNFQKNVNEQVFEITLPVKLPGNPSWESLPWPALNRICFNLFNREDCEDLANLSQV
ncbi:hypothetical protein PMAYCL1PPCAC_27479, partial [Pristionchus mayeri]